jgi:hypothetical protein
MLACVWFLISGVPHKSEFVKIMCVCVCARVVGEQRSKEPWIFCSNQNYVSNKIFKVNSRNACISQV